MEYTQLGRTGLKVSRLVLGTMNFGPQTDEADSHAIMDAALDAGINFFDTANVYGWGENKGRTEEIIGSWFAKGGGRRDKAVLATKVYGNMGADGRAPGPTTTGSPRSTSAAPSTRASSGCGPTTSTSTSSTTSTGARPVEEIWQAIDVLVQQGKILYAGSSNFAGWQDRPGQRDGRTPRHVRPGQRAVPLQPRRAPRRDGGHPGRAGVRPRASSPGRRCTAGCSAARSARSREGGAGAERVRAVGRRARRTPRCAQQIQAYEDLLDKHGLEPGEVALAWLLTRPGVTGPIVGPRTAEQLDSALRAVELELGDELLAALDEIFPGPGPVAGGLRLVTEPARAAPARAGLR